MWKEFYAEHDDEGNVIHTHFQRFDANSVDGCIVDKIDVYLLVDES